jgi:hypothetical protein
MRNLKIALLSVAVLLTASGIAFAQATNPSPLVTQSATVATTAGGQTLVLANPTRRFLQICNSGATNPVWICPAGVTPAANAAGCIPLAQVASNAAVCTSFPAISGINTAQWNAIATGGSTTVTVWEY